jgi:hypothetical protein
MIRASAVFYIFMVFFVSNVFAEIYSLKGESSRRNLNVVRRYEIAVQKGKPSVAALPAMISFQGETNWQIIKASRFTFSEQPDNTEVMSDNNGMPRRYYKVTWSAPRTDKITVEQVMEVELSFFNTLYTAAKHPYETNVLKRFSASLGADVNDGINPANPELGAVCDEIVKRSKSAEDVVEGVCDWINENIKLTDGRRTSDESLAQRKGNCTPMSRLACSMLRRIGIPAEMVYAKGIGSEGGHAFIEVYFPDAGWIFYDLSNLSRGFKSLDCLMTTGWAYLSGTPEKADWTDGHFCIEKDATPFVDQSKEIAGLIMKSPEGYKVVSVTVVAEKPPASVKIRERPLRELILDTTIPGVLR